MYIIVVASAQELPDVEELYEQIKKDERDESTTGQQQQPVIVFYNLKLDILRGDLGAPAFPSKELHDRFLSRIKPTYTTIQSKCINTTIRTQLSRLFVPCLSWTLPDLT